MPDFAITVIRIVLAVSALGYAAVILRAAFLRKDKQLHKTAFNWKVLGLFVLVAELLLGAGSRSFLGIIVYGFAVAFYALVTMVTWQGSKRYKRAYRGR